MGLTKKEVGVKPKPPKKPRRSPKKGKVTATNSVDAAKAWTIDRLVHEQIYMSKRACG